MSLTEGEKGKTRRPSVRQGAAKAKNPVSARVKDLLGSTVLDLELLAGSRGTERPVKDSVVKSLALPPAGSADTYEGRIHFLGPRGLKGLAAAPQKNQRKIANRLCSLRGAAMIIPAKPSPPEALLRGAGRYGLPLLRTSQSVQKCTKGVKALLEKRFALETTLHGVLMEVLGVGLLIIGPSGIGKSETALDLVMRGHGLIADDLVLVGRLHGERLMGRCAEMSGSHMEIRGLGIINIQDLFGVASVLKCKTIDLVVELLESRRHHLVDRLGLDEEFTELLGVKLNYLKVPVTGGRNMAAILEVAARNFLLKQRGSFTAREFDRALSRRLHPEGGEGKMGGEK